MIRENVVDMVFNRLQDRLGGALVVRPPATAEDLMQLEQLVGPLPRELALYLLTCNGCRINVDKYDRQWALWSIHDMIAALRGPRAASVSRSLIPIRGEDPGDRDWLLTGHDAAGGIVVRWDPWAYGVELIGSSFGAYLTAWSEFVVRGLRVDGPTAHVRRSLSPFDAQFTRGFDPRLSVIARDEGVQRCLSELGAVAASGDDID